MANTKPVLLSLAVFLLCAIVLYSEFWTRLLPRNACTPSVPIECSIGVRTLTATVNYSSERCNALYLTKVWPSLFVSLIFAVWKMREPNSESLPSRGMARSFPKNRPDGQVYLCHIFVLHLPGLDTKAADFYYLTSFIQSVFSGQCS